ncbi:shematrin-like protein 2 [Scylla paramamosain]|uniref:shematrin-like protein 2 n=1 Tax=Scylla paramamosain TaxID=85552 RepID=UPI00308281F7
MSAQVELTVSTTSSILLARDVALNKRREGRLYHTRGTSMCLYSFFPTLRFSLALEVTTLMGRTFVATLAKAMPEAGYRSYGGYGGGHVGGYGGYGYGYGGYGGGHGGGYGGYGYGR